VAYDLDGLESAPPGHLGSNHQSWLNACLTTAEHLPQAILAIECVAKGKTACVPDAKGNVGNGHVGADNFGRGCIGNNNIGACAPQLYVAFVPAEYILPPYVRKYLVAGFPGAGLVAA
jgi:hypothetical protein